MFNAPLKNARGLGSAKDGTHHWIVQRLTAVALIPLVIWFAYSVATQIGSDYAAVVQWIALPWNTVLLVSFLATGFWHSALGVQVVIEDYVAGEFAKFTLLIASKLAHALLGLAAIISVLKISFGA